MSVKTQSIDLASAAQEIFQRALRSAYPADAMKSFVHCDRQSLSIGDEIFDLHHYQKIYSVAYGKAAFPMAQSLSGLLGEKLVRGVISCPSNNEKLSDEWQIFHGGHPVPNEDSLSAARAALALLNETDAPDSLIIFLVSGGGSAMLELPVSDSITLADLQAANQVLVTCGAKISEVNAVRRYISKIKGGGLRRAALKAAQVSLIVSDTNAGELQTVASGATFSFGDETELVREVIERYRLSEVLPRSVIEALTQSKSEGVAEDFFESAKRHFLLLDNSQAVEKAIQAASALGFVVESAIDLVETQIDKGCAELVKRLLEMREEMAFEQPVAIVSGGEFVCPVRGNGIGGRNLESALRTAILFDELSRTENYRKTKFTALFAGTDGIDGNSTAAGAIADETTIARARNLGLTPEYFLADSDSYNFFRVLNQQIEIGATGTNVRDIRILLMN